MMHTQEAPSNNFNIFPRSMAVAMIAGLAIASSPMQRPEEADARPVAGEPQPANIETGQGRVQPAPESIHPDYSKPRLRWLLLLRICESGNNYKIHTGNGFEGAYQFLPTTWNSLDTGYAHAHQAPPKVQDKAIVKNTFRSPGGISTQNPGCYQKLGLSKFPPG